MNAFTERGQFERYRLMLISMWPESEAKWAALASARAALNRERPPMPSHPGEEPVVLAIAA